MVITFLLTILILNTKFKYCLEVIGEQLRLDPCIGISSDSRQGIQMNNKRPKLSEAVRYFKDVYDHVGKSVPAAGQFIGGKVNYTRSV